MKQKTKKNATVKSRQTKSNNKKDFPKDICNSKMTFEECEQAIMRQSVERVQKLSGEKTLNTPTIQKIIQIIEQFLVRKKLICYGGTAINNILPKEYQFYDKSYEMPDYDFFSPNAMDDVKELADIYYYEGFTDVEAKAGMHKGTYKLFVNFIPIADITFLDEELFTSLKKDAIVVSGIYYAPANYLRMSMYLELSRPRGDTSRWDKVLKRLNLLNKVYPIHVRGLECSSIEIQRAFEYTKQMKMNDDDVIDLFTEVKDAIIDQGLIFFGAFATSLYMKHLPKQKYDVLKKKMRNQPDFDVLSEDPETSAVIIQERLQEAGFKKVSIQRKESVGEIIGTHYEVKVGGDSVAFIYQPLACHSYNTIKLNGKILKIATIDTILSFYLAFMYIERPYYDIDRLLCMAEYLFTIQQKHRTQTRGILKRFSIRCYGDQETLGTLRNKKAQMYKLLQNKRDSKLYDEWFLRYVPGVEHRDVPIPINVDIQNANDTLERKNTKSMKKKRNTRKKRKTQKKKRTFLSKLFMK